MLNKVFNKKKEYFCIDHEVAERLDTVDYNGEFFINNLLWRDTNMNQRYDQVQFSYDSGAPFF